MPWFLNIRIAIVAENMFNNTTRAGGEVVFD
jgi:hypothetical protein